MTTAQVTVAHRAGLHARPAALFVKSASRFECSVSVRNNDKQVSAKSIVQVLRLGVTTGTVITIIADGRDEATAVETLIRLVESNFDETK